MISLFEKYHTEHSSWFAKHAELRSIQHHLQHFLNTRDSSLPQLDKYGVADLGRVYQEMPNSVNYFLNELIQRILRYEPRIEQLVLVNSEVNHNNHVLVAKLNAVIRDLGEVIFSAEFDASGQVNVPNLEGAS